MNLDRSVRLGGGLAPRIAVIADGSSTVCLDIFTSYMGAASPTNTAFILRTGTESTQMQIVIAKLS